MLKLLIADSTEEFRLALAEQVAGSFTVRCAQQGKEALELICSYKPDILVLDLMMPGLDGISILEQAAQKGIRPTVLATTRFANDYVQDAVTRLGVCYLMVKPCDLKATAARLTDMAEHRKPQPLARPDIRIMVSIVLLSLGIPTKLRGFTYLREAIVAAMRQPGQMVTKEIYPAVGHICGASKDQVERSIRSAIAAGFANRDEQVWRQYFQPGPGGNLIRPSNGTFISALAERFLSEEDFPRN